MKSIELKFSLCEMLRFWSSALIKENLTGSIDVLFKFMWDRLREVRETQVVKRMLRKARFVKSLLWEMSKMRRDAGKGGIERRFSFFRFMLVRRSYCRQGDFVKRELSRMERSLGLWDRLICFKRGKTHMVSGVEKKWRRFVCIFDRLMCSRWLQFWKMYFIKDLDAHFWCEKSSVLRKGMRSVGVRVFMFLLFNRWVFSIYCNKRYFSSMYTF